MATMRLRVVKVKILNGDNETSSRESKNTKWRQ